MALPAGAVGGSVSPGTAAAGSAWLPWAAQAAWPATGSCSVPLGLAWGQRAREAQPCAPLPCRSHDASHAERRGATEGFL